MFIYGSIYQNTYDYILWQVYYEIEVKGHSPTHIKKYGAFTIQGHHSLIQVWMYLNIDKQVLSSLDYIYKHLFVVDRI